MNTIIKKLSKEEYSKLKPHSLLQYFGMKMDRETDGAFRYYAKEADHFNHYDKPIVTIDGFVIGNFMAFQAAINNDLPELEVEVILDLEEDDVLRFVNAKSLFFKKSYVARFRLFKLLKEYLETNPKGILWAKTLTGDINVKVGTITGYHKETVKLVNRIGNKNESLFEKIDDGELALTAAAKQCPEEPDNTGAIALESSRIVKKKFSPSDFKPQFKDDKPSVQVYGKSIPLFEKQVLEYANSVTYIYKSKDEEARVEIKIVNLKHFKSIS